MEFSDRPSDRSSVLILYLTYPSHRHSVQYGHILWTNFPFRSLEVGDFHRNEGACNPGLQLTQSREFYPPLRPSLSRVTDTLLVKTPITHIFLRQQRLRLSEKPTFKSVNLNSARICRFSHLPTSSAAASCKHTWCTSYAHPRYATPFTPTLTSQFQMFLCSFKMVSYSWRHMRPHSTATGKK